MKKAFFKKLPLKGWWWDKDCDSGATRVALKRDAEKEVERELREIEREKERRNGSWNPEDWDDF